MDVVTVRLFSSRPRQPSKDAIGARKYSTAGKFLGKLHLNL